MAKLSEEMDHKAALYRRFDRRSFWARDTNGLDHLVRMQTLDSVSERAAALLNDERLLAIANSSGDGHEPNTAAGLVEALTKPVGIIERISDFPWHKDCSLGRHSYECCSLVVGISVTGSDAMSGQLRVLAGSSIEP